MFLTNNTKGAYIYTIFADNCTMTFYVKSTIASTFHSKLSLLLRRDPSIMPLLFFGIMFC